MQNNKPTILTDTQKLLDAINQAYKEMLEEKMLHNQMVVTSDENGNTVIIDAKEAYDMMCAQANVASMEKQSRIVSSEQ